MVGALFPAAQPNSTGLIYHPGATEKGTWVRVLDPPVEGKVVQGFAGFDAGDRVQVKLVAVNVERGFIDFVGVS